MNNFEYYEDELKEIAKKDGIYVTQPKFVELMNNRYATLGDFVLWLYEKHEILNEQEKEYLSAVIKPFKDRVTCIIKKSSMTTGREFIDICIFDDLSIEMPFFKKDTMYKGMKSGKFYKLDELGL